MVEVATEQKQNPAKDLHPKDPRNNPNHRERGYREYIYTYRDLAKLFGISVNAIRQAVYRGCFDPRDMASIIRYYNKRRPSE